MAEFVQRATCPSCRAVFLRRMPYCPGDGTALAPLPEDPLIGSLVAHRYTIERVVADGATTRCYLASDGHTGDTCLMRVLYGDYAAIVRYRERFAREIHIARCLGHPGVLRVRDSGETPGGVPFVVHEEVRGPALGALIAREAPLPRVRVLALLGDVCSILAHVHRHRVVLRNLGGKSFLVGQQLGTERVVLVDLSGALQLESDRPGAQRLTRRGKVLATPAYMAPEQGSEREIDHRADLFSLGVLLYEMLSGKLPYQGSALAVAAQYLQGEPPPLRQRVPGLRVDPDLEGIVTRLLRARPGDRYGTADELLRQVNELRISAA
jgi:serine/threonine-protein kinase